MSGLGVGDPWLGVTGVHTTVLGGQPVWLLTLHQLLVAEDCRVFLDRPLEGVDFSAVLSGRGRSGDGSSRMW